MPKDTKPPGGGLDGVPDRIPELRIVNSASMLATLTGWDRATVRKNLGLGMPYVSKKSTRRGDDYTFDLAGVLAWWHGQGVALGKEQAPRT